MPTYSQKAYRALAYLFRPYNDIDVYVEDTLSRNMYEILFQRMLGGRAKVERIFQLKGKRTVVEACINDQADARRRRLYIVDGDYDVFTGEAPPALNYFYRLNVYSSENLVLTKHAVLEVAYESSTNEKKEDVERKIAYEAFIGDLVQLLLPLFVLHAALHAIATAHGIHVHIPTTNYSVFQLGNQQRRRFILAETKIDARINDVIDELVRDYGFDRVELDSVVAEIEARLPAPTSELVKYISAKTHIFPLLLPHLRRTVNFMGKLEQLKVLLARHCELDVDAGLLAAVIDTSRGR